MKANIAILPGDGIGPEITHAAHTVLEAIAQKYHHTFTYHHGLIGGAAIDATGSALPAETIAICEQSDAILLGAVGGPKWDSSTVRPEQGLLAIRKHFHLFANIRPVKPMRALLHASPLKPELLEHVDIVVMRELTGGVYFGDKTLEATRATDMCVYTVSEIERIVRLACQVASKRRGKVTSIDKANVLATSKLWREVATRIVRDEFPHIALEHQLVDSAAMLLIKHPSAYDVIVTENMFGDILTDEASVLAASLGMLPSASMSTSAFGLYEPIHGSAPDLAGKNCANPCGTILSAALLLRHSLHLETEAALIEQAIEKTVAQGIRTADITDSMYPSAVSTQAFTQQVVQYIA